MDSEFEVHSVQVKGNAAVILEPSSGPPPGYDVHGETQCVLCDAWCRLDEYTLPLVLKGQARPLCVPCARPVIGPDQFIGNARDLL